VALALRLLLLGPPAVEQVVGNAQLSGHLRDQSCCVADQSNCFRLKLFCVLPSGLGAHTVLQFHHTPPYTGVCEIGGRSLALRHAGTTEAVLLLIQAALIAAMITVLEISGRCR
jgi:hypothetical protein